MDLKSPLAALPLRHGDPVTACDCALPGRITMDYGHQPQTPNPEPGTADAGPRYFRVQFPIGSPFLDDWAVYREGELQRRAKPPEPKPPEQFKENYPPSTSIP